MSILHNYHLKKLTTTYRLKISRAKPNILCNFLKNISEAEYMKKRLLLLLAILLIFIATYNWSFSQRDIASEASIKNISIENNYYLPVRKLFEGMNFSVKWLAKEKSVLMYNEDNFIKLNLKDDYFIYNGELVKHELKPLIRNGKFYVSIDSLKDVLTDFEYDASKELLVFKSVERFRSLETLPSVENKSKLDKLLTLSNQLQNDVMTFARSDVDFLETTEDIAFEAEMKSDDKFSMTNSDESGHSETNVQVKGVDEGDIVKTDGSYIYTLSNNSIYIVNSQRDDFKVVNTLNFVDYDPIEFYVRDNKLVTIGYFHGINIDTDEGDIDYRVYSHYSNSLKILVHDISDKSDITLLRNVQLDGSYLSSRLIDDKLYLVANKWVYYEDKEPRPYYNDSLESEISFIDYEDIKYFPESVYNNYLITLGLDLSNLDSSKIDIGAYLGSGNNMYASTENMYITQDKYRYNIYELDKSIDNSMNSSIFKFRLENGKITYESTGEVPGTILNQFSMDEQSGNFRIATTKGDSWWGNDSKSISNVYVLDNSMKIIGKTKDLAPGERIYSVRFMGDKVYVVTFRQVDPFYVIDLKEPTDPKVLGYLKIPGYSSYLHPFDEKHIIGIGMDTIETDGRVINGGVKISMFDVTDFSNPVELDKMIIGGRGSYTDISHDHKSLLFSKEKNILSFPIYASNYDKNTYKHTFETQAAFVFSIDEDYKFNLRGNISHLDSEDDYMDHIRRILYIDDSLYTISDNMIKISDFDTLENIKDLQLEEIK